MICGSVFSGIGLLDYGLHLAGIQHAWFCEADEWRRGILAQRWPDARVHADVRHVGHGCEPVELIAGGFPCKGGSTAGKRNGFEHPETVLWFEMLRAVRELRPRYVLVENVAHLLALHDGAVWGTVLGGLAESGYDVVWDCLPAGAVGAPHRRDRVFAVASYAAGELERVADHEAHAESRRRDTWPLLGVGGAEPVADALRPGLEGRGLPGPVADRVAAAADAERGVHGHPGRGDLPGATSTGETEASQRERLRSDTADGDRGVRVEWGDYEPAIRRWEAIHGPAPEPLVRRVDDRSAARVERSRLSALGDGVQVQVGRIVGEYIMGLERARRGLADAA